MSDVASKPTKAVATATRSASPGGEVTSLDFSRPHRLSEDSLAEIRKKLTKALPALQAHLKQSLGPGWSPEIEQVGEESADRFFERVLQAGREPLVVCFWRLANDPASVSWERSAATLAVDAALGTPAGSGPAAPAGGRRLSRIESRLIGDFLAGIVQRIASALGLQASGFEFLQDEQAIQEAAEEKRGLDPLRLEIALSIRGPNSSNTLWLHLGGFRPSASAAAQTPVKLPEHLEAVRVEVCARVGSSDVCLSQVLELEEGDVIPLETRLGEPAWISVEGKDFARARLGTYRGRLALKIEGLVARDAE